MKSSAICCAAALLVSTAAWAQEAEPKAEAGASATPPELSSPNPSAGETPPAPESAEGSSSGEAPPPPAPESAEGSSSGEASPSPSPESAEGPSSAEVPPPASEFADPSSSVGTPPPISGVGSVVSEEEFQPPRPPTAMEVMAAESSSDELSGFSKELQYFERGTQDFLRDQQAQIKAEYEVQKDILARRYENKIEELESEERDRRVEAISRFESFIQKYPNQPSYTPDAMFRLAELYFEASSDEFLRESRAYESELLAWELGERASEPRSPEPRFDKTIGLHRELLSRFPKYRLADAARYLLGYAYGEMGDEQQALASFQSLVENNPESPFLPEVWTRIGEIHFDGNTSESLEMAVAAYGEVLNFKDSPYYDKALYKIAWTYYRLDEFDKSVDSFTRLVRYADEQQEATGVTGSELRSEAIQYMAISFADDTWGGFETAQTKLRPMEDEPFAQEVWNRYGDILYDQTRYEESIQALNYSLERYPSGPSNPEAQARIVQAYEQLRDFDSATKAREQLVERFGQGSVWLASNQENEEALASASALTEKSLSTAALFRHEQAQRLRAQGETDKAKQQYMAASEAYTDYLGRFPKSNRAYDFGFFLAETLYYSDRYSDAASQYKQVRDSRVNNKHLETAALFAVLSHERQVENLEKSGEIKKRAVLTAAQRNGKPPKPMELPKARKNLVDASDRFVQLVPASENVGAISYRAAEEFYKHDQFELARERFEKIVAEHPTEEVAQFAANLIIESYLAVEDWGRVDEWSGRLIELAQNQQGKEGPRGALVEGLQDVQLKAQFKIAEQYSEEKKHEKAAEAYISLVDKNPQGDVADKALFNAALSFEKVSRFDSASKVFQRIVDDYPGSSLAPRALFQVGINADRGFDFETAIGAYNRLATKYPDAEQRVDAMYNVAVVYENMQAYDKAARAYQRYSELFRARPDAGEVYFRSGLVYQKMGAHRKAATTFASFTDQYKRAPQQRERIVRAFLEKGRSEVKQGRGRAARRSYQTCISEFNRLRLSISSRAGAYAAQCTFELAEFKFKAYDALKIAGSERQQVSALGRKAKSLKDVERAYTDVVRYKRLEQTLAAFYRIGYAYERFADSVFSAPIPPSLEKDPELADEYRAQLEDRAAVLERKAEDAYRKAYAQARENGVTNQWTERMLEGLNKFAPSEFPIQKKGKPAMQTEFITGRGFDAGLTPTKAPASVEGTQARLE